MKLRIRGNSIRLRLSQGEVSRIAAGETVEERVELSPQPFAYALVASPEVERPAVAFDAGRLDVQLPSAVARRWAESEQVGVAAEIAVAPDRPVRLLIEKDFECLHGDAEENRDAFPNPNAG